MSASTSFSIRKAIPADVPELRELIDASVRGLQAEDYTATQIESALATVFGVDSQLIADGTRAVRPRAPSSDRCRIDPRVDAAKIRAFFIHPEWARRGIGTIILQACEDAAAAAGFTRCEMGATLTGVKLFGARGYVAIENISVPLKNGEGLPVVRMAKQLA